MYCIKLSTDQLHEYLYYNYGLGLSISVFYNLEEYLNPSLNTRQLDQAIWKATSGKQQ